jgi:hypothetical protein
MEAGTVKFLLSYHAWNTGKIYSAPSAMYEYVTQLMLVGDESWQHYSWRKRERTSKHTGS